MDESSPLGHARAATSGVKEAMKQYGVTLAPGSPRSLAGPFPSLSSPDGRLSWRLTKAANTHAIRALPLSVVYFHVMTSKAYNLNVHRGARPGCPITP